MVRQFIDYNTESDKAYGAYFERLRGLGVSEPCWQYFWSAKTRKAISLMGPMEGKTVLDIGCGDGQLLGQISDVVELAIGIDILRQNFPSDRLKNTHFVVADASCLPFKHGCFDTVVSTDVLEHLTPGDAEQTAREVHRVLNNDGSFVLTTPRGGSGLLRLCAFAPFIVPEIVLGLILMCCSSRYRQYMGALRARRAAHASLTEKYGIKEHTKEYTERGLTDLLARANFNVKATSGSSIAPQWTRFRLWNYSRALFLVWRATNSAAPRMSRKLCADICLLSEKVQSAVVARPHTPAGIEVASRSIPEHGEAISQLL
jgi:ubiquinone/menaquinone biosynthesis C-methylase UbiE